MKYGNLTLGQIEALVNKLGGIQVVEDLLANKLEVVKRATHLLVSLITAAKFDWVNSRITPENFPEEPIRSEDYKVYHFNRRISSDDAIAEITKDGYLPANLYEFLKWNGWDGNQTVVALGSSRVVGGDRFMPYCSRDMSERRLGLDSGDSVWDDSYRFLAVRNPAVTAQ